MIRDTEMLAGRSRHTLEGGKIGRRPDPFKQVLSLIWSRQPDDRKMAG